jgi:hypothetical protein
VTLAMAAGASFAGCGATAVATATPTATSTPTATATATATSTPTPTATATSTATATATPTATAAREHWFFEWLSPDGKRALVRRLDASRRSFHARVVDVDSGATLQEVSLDELGSVPFESIGKSNRHLAALDFLVYSAELAQDLVQGARVAGPFPFGACGRMSAAPDGAAIAFNAGDWLYVADKEGRVKRRVADDASYDPRFTPDGKHILFRKLTGRADKAAGRYELFTVPADLSAPPRRIEGTAGARDPIVVAADGATAITITSSEPGIKTCVVSVALKPPFAAKRGPCLDGGEAVVESVLSPRGKWAALTTQRRVADPAGGQRTAWRLRVVSVGAGKTALDAAAEPGLSVRAVSDDGLVVQSGLRGVLIDDVPARKQRALDRDDDLGYRGFFRSGTELVVVRGRDVTVLDLAKE